ncbi:UDP-2,4-diacetamido-2,4,6-trideoxy-beta-L-altropyranose hydrolase [Marinobacter sp. F4206]|uniref:UDP-2,4-diacetamido-2,4, 6-trideoxy-beta-L-altropyranose hydrolase n=1 Tax=Marinobacter sp. F4206 TaxID=2861777 RepID=UPI001C5F6EAD|nr:UDP-2,4-diacetamido-2,4,6-trideoxy-beta-L-altropyranose hydrolase [Marinobacter sp. F4206]MBW4933774.1 UDP-2,4-diacetamido-2,4,6-trideoxy-beta-L-altropyranose hydrolase [Marinobacter sp. F4206]
MAGKMVVVFRVDASLEIGTGHAMRCLTLADVLQAKHARCIFVMRNLPGNLESLVKSKDHEVRMLPERGPSDSEVLTGHEGWLRTDWKTDAADTIAAIQDAPPDWLIVDHYALDARWEQALADSVESLLVIDDLADRPHVCDVLLDQNLGRSQSDYDGLLPQTAVKLMGLRYALLRPEFADKRAISIARRRSGAVQTILVSMGGVDSENITSDVLRALDSVQELKSCHVTVVMGRGAPHAEEISELIQRMRLRARMMVNVGDMASLMSDADLAIGAAGGTAWERCCLGLPSLLVVMAANQKPGTDALARTGAALAVGDRTHVSESLAGAVRSLLDPAHIRAMSDRAASLCDGQGVRRVVAQMLGGA